MPIDLDFRAIHVAAAWARHERRIAYGDKKKEKDFEKNKNNYEKEDIDWEIYEGTPI